MDDKADTKSTSVFERRHELDWLRILAFFVLIFYYTGMPFIKGDAWNIVNDQRSSLLSVIWHFLHTWRLPLLFMISGMGVAYAFRKRSGQEFLLERTRRLLLPLLFGVLVFIPPQIYVKLLFQDQSPGNYLNVYPAFFNGFDPPGNFTFSHLWFLIVLFAFCIIALPLFLWLRSSSGERTLTWLQTMCETRFGFFLAAVPIIIGVYLLQPVSSGFWTNWQDFYLYLCMFIMGYIVASRPGVCSAKRRYRYTYLIITIVSYLFYFANYYLERLADYDTGMIDAWRIIAMLSLILTAFGFAQIWLSRPSAFLRYTNEAVYPYYIVQPTVIIVLSYIAVQWNIHWVVKFAFIVFGSYTITGLVYHFLIRPFNPIRPLFGMKLKR